MDHLSIADPSDFASTTVPSLAEFDSTLRCQVCKELFDTPMLTSCSHTFCSKCIRQCLSADGKCPTCRAQDQPTKLRKNGIAQALVLTWTQSRPAVLLAVQRHDRLGAPGAGKRKLESEEEQAPSRYHKRASVRRTTHLPEEHADTARKGNDDDDDADHRPDEEQRLGGLQLVQCPICSQYMKEAQVFGHLDTCQTAPPPPRPSSHTPNKLLPYINYHLVKEKDLRKKFTDLGIPTHGPKPALERRHTQWLNIWNANCDSDAPRPRRELLAELGAWERAQSHAGATTSGFAPASTLASKEFDADGWSRRHNKQFRTLVAQARAGRGVDAEPAEGAGPVDTNKDAVLVASLDKHMDNEGAA